VKLHQGNVYVVVTDVGEDDERWLREYLAFDDKAAKYRGRFRRDNDGRLMLYNLVRGTFPAGLLPSVTKAAQKEGRSFEVVDERARPCEPDPSIDVSWLRDYQRESVDAAIAATRGIVKAATGSGKTEIFIALVRMLPCRWLMLVHRTTLVRQAAERFELRTGELAGVISEGAWDDSTRFVCASFQSLLADLRRTRKGGRAQALLESVGGIIVDECHTVPAASTRAIVSMARNAYWRYGFSGTPLDRSDERSIFAVAALGPIIHTVEARTLIDAGVLAAPDIHLVQHEHFDPPGGSYSAIYSSCVVQDERRMRTVVEAVRACEKPALVFVREIEHGKRVTEALTRAGVRAAFAWGSSSTDERTVLVRMLVAGTVDALVCSVVFQEGIDIPELRGVVNASGGRSIIATIQRIGRGMRLSAGKTTFQVWDVLDLGQRWLVRHSRERSKAYKREGFTAKIVSAEQVEQMALDSGRAAG
jgi:superfamily II DNA or RNA helicase